jgi:hypothetical protein
MKIIILLFIIFFNLKIMSQTRPIELPKTPMAAAGLLKYYKYSNDVLHQSESCVGKEQVDQLTCQVLQVLEKRNAIEGKDEKLFDLKFLYSTRVAYKNGELQCSRDVNYYLNQEQEIDDRLISQAKLMREDVFKYNGDFRVEIDSLDLQEKQFYYLSPDKKKLYQVVLNQTGQSKIIEYEVSGAILNPLNLPDLSVDQIPVEANLVNKKGKLFTQKAGSKVVEEVKNGFFYLSDKFKNIKALNFKLPSKVVFVRMEKDLFDHSKCTLESSTSVNQIDCRVNGTGFIDGGVKITPKSTEITFGSSIVVPKEVRVILPELNNGTILVDGKLKVSSKSQSTGIEFRSSRTPNAVTMSLMVDKPKDGQEVKTLEIHKGCMKAVLKNNREQGTTVYIMRAISLDSNQACSIN